LPNFLVKRGVSVASSLDARLVEDAVFLNTIIGSGREVIGFDVHGDDSRKAADQADVRPLTARCGGAQASNVWAVVRRS
jgi:hypothetical protein